MGEIATFAAGALQSEMGWQAIRNSFVGSAETSAMVVMIFLGADMMTAALALTGMPSAVADLVSHLPVAPLAVVGAVLRLYVLLGCVMDELSMLLLTVLVIFLAIMGLELWGLGAQDKAIWIGILALMTVGIGMTSPPVVAQCVGGQ